MCECVWRGNGGWGVRFFFFGGGASNEGLTFDQQISSDHPDYSGPFSVKVKMSGPPRTVPDQPGSCPPHHSSLPPHHLLPYTLFSWSLHLLCEKKVLFLSPIGIRGRSARLPDFRLPAWPPTPPPSDTHTYILTLLHPFSF